jgi:hypothetical protein
MSTNYTQQISEEECIGDSLDKINNNFSSLDATCATLSSTFTAAYACERNGVGDVGQLLAHGSGASAHRGLCMPYNGKVIAATLQGASINGTVSVQAYLNGTSLSEYSLTYTGTFSNGSDIETFSPPLSFEAGDTLGWIQTVKPAAGTFNVNYLVVYNL